MKYIVKCLVLEILSWQQNAGISKKLFLQPILIALTDFANVCFANGYLISQERLDIRCLQEIANKSCRDLSFAGSEFIYRKQSIVSVVFIYDSALQRICKTKSYLYIKSISHFFRDYVQQLFIDKSWQGYGTSNCCI